MTSKNISINLHIELKNVRKSYKDILGRTIGKGSSFYKGTLYVDGIRIRNITIRAKNVMAVKRKLKKMFKTSNVTSQLY